MMERKQILFSKITLLPHFFATAVVSPKQGPPNEFYFMSAIKVISFIYEFDLENILLWSPSKLTSIVAPVAPALTVTLIKSWLEL